MTRRRGAPPASKPPGPTRSCLQLDVPEAEPLQNAVARACLPAVTLFRPAHVTLAPSWLLPPETAPAVAQLVGVLAAIPVFDASITALRRFPADSTGRVVVYATPEPVDRFLALVAATTGERPGVVPHLSVARTGPDGAEVADQIEALVEPRLPLPFVARDVQLRVQYERMWRVEQVLHLAPDPERP